MDFDIFFLFCQWSMITGLSKSLDHNEPFEFESNHKTAEVEIDLQLSMQEKLTRAIDKEMNSKISYKSRITKEFTSIVKKELAILEVEGKRGVNLERCYENFNSIPHYNLQKRGTRSCFFRCGRTFTKIRSSLHDDMLSFLRGNFKTENNCQFKFPYMFLFFKLFSTEFN
jgi:hypothetical protein